MGPLVRADVRDRALVAAALREYHPVAVVHMAANAYVGESVTCPHLYYDNNVAGTISLLEAIRESECRAFVFSSTCAVYGIPQQLPITEALPTAPVNPYGHGKLMVERVLTDYEYAYGLRSARLRYFNAAGAAPSDKIGELHDPEPHIIPTLLAAALDPAVTATVFGDDYPTVDGTCVRDYVHVVDLAAAHVRAVEHLLQGGESVTLNLGIGHGYSIRQLVETVKTVTGREVKVKVGPRRPGDPPALVSEAKRAQEVLGWIPTHTDITAMVADAMKFREMLGPSSRVPK